jgi:hypothetical protein
MFYLTEIFGQKDILRDTLSELFHETLGKIKDNSELLLN